MAKKRKRRQPDHAELPTAKRRLGRYTYITITTVSPFIGHYDKVYKSYHPDVPMKVISGESKILTVAKGGISLCKSTVMKGTKEVTKGATQELATTFTKEMTEKVAETVVEKVPETMVEKVPGISLGFGIAFGVYRAVCAIYLLSKGEKARGGEEIAKAILEVISGLVASIPGPGTAYSLILDGSIAAWDIADSYIHDEEADKKKKEHYLMLLHGDLTTIKGHIENEEYSSMEFADCMLREIFKKFPATDNDQKCVDFRIYLNLLLKLIRENSFFKDNSAFSTNNLYKEMEEIGFSEKQIDCCLLIL